MDNPELELAWQFVNQTKRHIFLTGKAGTGKTTFLHQLKLESPKRLAVVAPTGVAAINARGVTIHSFFQMPFGPILPGETQQHIQRDYKQKFSKKKIDIIKSLDLLIIDEISMVRADLLDAIDQILRKYNNRNKIFGGIQVLMIGDLQQLAPVVKPNEWDLLKKYYDTPYFFSSQAFRKSNAINIELKNIYRQEDREFITILNEIRENKLTPASAERLNKRYIPDFTPDEQEDYITLTTHNYKADRINQDRLKALPDKTFYYHAHIEGHFPENAYPNDKKLALKKGAQVMFIKNDTSFEKRYYNGKIGRVTFIDDKNIYVKCPGDEQEIEVHRETWDNVTYEIDKETQKISEKIQGGFSQIPLRLAWAITIHKSQGLTFEKAIIDAEMSFAHGQTYVALSRCKTLEGLVLKSPVKSQSIINDRRVTGFTNHIAEHQPDEAELSASKKQFFIESLKELFDFAPLRYDSNRLLNIYQTNVRSIQGDVLVPLQDMKVQLEKLITINDKFISQIQSLSKDLTEPSLDKTIQERIEKALDYFKEQFQPIKTKFENIGFDIDNKQVKKDFTKFYDRLSHLIKQKNYVFENLQLPFILKNYLDIRAKAQLQNSGKKKISYVTPKNLKHIDLLEALKDLRSEFAYQEDVHHFQIFTQETLYELCEKLPVTTAQLKKISGIGKVRLKKYGQAITETILNYCIANDIEINTEEPVKKPKIDTKALSLQLYQSGKSIKEIAKERDLTANTIMGHLSHFTKTGEVKITDLITEERFKKIKQIIENNDFGSLGDLKKIAGDTYDWGELRLVMNYLMD